MNAVNGNGHGVHLPPAEPPADEVGEALHLLAYARAQLLAAESAVRRAHQLAGYAGGETASMTTRVMVRVREYTASCWRAEVTHLERIARDMGLEP